MTAEVLYVAGKDPLNEPGGGHSAYVRAHAHAAVRAGFHPHIFCVSDSNLESETTFGTIHSVYSPWRPRRQLMIAGHAPRLAAGIVEFVESRKRPYVVHGFGLWGYAGVLACRRIAQSGITSKSILSSYTTYETEARSQVASRINAPLSSRLFYHTQHLWVRTAVERYERLAYVNSELVLINYESVRRLIESKYGTSVRCLKVPYTCESAFDSADASQNLIDLTTADRPGIPLIIAVASHHPRKGHEVLLAALKILDDAGASFRTCIIGGGPLLEEHRRYARELGIADKVTLTGLVDDVTPYLRSADIFVLPSIAEQSGSLAVLEALQAGLPIVAAAVDGLCEDLTDDHDSLLVPPTSASLAGALRRLLEDRSLRARLSKNARQTFDVRFSADHFAHALGSVYEELQAGMLHPQAARVCS
jgi:glycosyltransferase involved in cell wall biosynthesis